MLALTANPKEVLKALPELEKSLSLRELVVREERLVAELDAPRQGHNEMVKYVTTLLRTHIHFIQNTSRELSLEVEIERITYVLSGLVENVFSVGAAVLHLLKERHAVSRTFPDGYTRTGLSFENMNVLEDDDFYTL